MLKTNSKKAVENIRAYIVYIYDDEEQFAKRSAPFKKIAQTIYNAFVDQKWSFEKRRYNSNEQEAFEEWAQGLRPFRTVDGHRAVDGLFLCPKTVASQKLL